MLSKNILRTSSSIYILSLLLIVTFYLAFWFEGWIGALLLVVDIGFGITLLGLLTLRFIRFFRVESRTRQQFKPFLTGLAAIGVVVFRPIEQINESLKSPVMISGYCEHTVTEVYFVFRRNKEFEYNAGAFIKKEMYYGTYKLNADTIHLSFNEAIPNNVNPTLLLDEYAFIEVGDTTRHRHYFKYIKNEFN